MKGDGSAVHILRMGNVRPSGERKARPRKATKAKRCRAKVKARRVMQGKSRRRNRI